MEQNGKHYTIDCGAYPRYRYFNEGRRSIITRWSKMIEGSGIQERIPAGKKRYEAIIRESNQLANNVGLYVFGDIHLPSPDEFCVQKDQKFIVDQKSVTTTDIDRNGFEPNESIILVLVKEEYFVIQTVDSSATIDITQVFAEMTDDMSAVIKHISDVPVAIQEALEKRVINVLSLTGEFNECLIPKPMTGDEDVVSVDIRRRNLQHTLCNRSTLKDLIHDEGHDHNIWQRLLKFCVNVIRCVICEYLSQKLGIRAWLINAFLNDESCEFDAKVESCFPTSERPPHWKNESELETFIKTKLKTLMNAVEVTEEYLKECLDVFKRMGKLQFELYGLSRESNVLQDFLIPVPNHLPSELQTSLLEIDNVIACGDVYGDLTIFVKDTLTPEDTKRKIHDTIRRCKYGYCYSVKVVREFREQASGDVVTGAKTCAESIGVNQHKFGTVCCFANIKQNTDKEASANLYALTCAHCVLDCNSEVKVPGELGDFRLLGYHEYMVYRPYSIDIAAIRVDSEVSQDCIRALFKQDGRTLCNKWALGDVSPGATVYKVGATTGLTKGIVTSTEFAYAVFDRYQTLTRNEGKQFLRTNTILVEYPSDDPKLMPDKPFSVGGDSGAAICKENPDGSISVVGILCGELDIGYSITYAGKMPFLVKCLEARNGIQVTPAAPDHN